MVEDNPTNRKVLKAMLNQSGVQCDFVENGQQAVDAITGAVVAVDIETPEQQAKEAAEDAAKSKKKGEDKD